MQTFLPYADFYSCSRVLDSKRLGKQRVECKQILLALKNGGAWSNHPAVKMWRGYEPALCRYAVCMCREWTERGYVDNLFSFFPQYAKVTYPDWLGREDLHKSHRRALIYKGWCDAIWEAVRQHPEYRGKFKKSELTYSDYMVFNDYVNVDWTETEYSKLWPELLPSVPLAPNGSPPYVWPVQ